VVVGGMSSNSSGFGGGIAVIMIAMKIVIVMWLNAAFARLSMAT